MKILKQYKQQRSNIVFTESKNDIVNSYIHDLPDSIRELFLTVRGTILDAAGELEESIKWKNCLVYTAKRNIIQTVVGKEKISLIFFDGATIQDSYSLLEGDGKQTRTMRISSMDFNAEALRGYVAQAVQLAGDK